MTNKVAKISEALVEVNKWWKNRFAVDYKPRNIYPQLKKFLATKQILALTGLRRVGKTTLLFKIVQDELATGVDPTHIIYFSFDEFRDIKLREIINAYAYLMNKDLTRGRYLWLFDEVQKLRDWEEQIKRIYDNYANFKLIISGSESLFIRKRTRESLVGRCFEFKIGQLSFDEFLAFKNISITNINLYRQELLKEFQAFLYCNGFPEIISAERDVVEKYINETIIEKIIYRDIPQIFPVRDVEILENLFNIILNDPGEMINIINLANELGVSRQTTSLYLDYLEKSFLIKKLYNFSRSIRKTVRKLKKFYPTIIPPKLIEQGAWGKVLETAMVLQLNADFFWRDVYKNKVDIVLTDKHILPVEVKSGEKIDTRSLERFMEKFGVKKGLVISLDEEKSFEKKGSLIEVVPAYKILLRGEK